MSNKYRMILKISLVLYLILIVFQIIHVYNDKLLENVLKIGTYPLHITSLILFVYVGNRGEEKICNFGLISIFLFFIMSVLSTLSVYEIATYASASFTNRMCSILYYTSSNCISIAEYLALFSLISGNEKIEKYKILAVACIVGFSILNLVNHLFPKTSTEIVGNVKSTLDYIGMLGKYVTIIIYLTDRNYGFGSSSDDDLTVTDLLHSAPQTVAAVSAQSMVSNAAPIQPVVEQTTVPQNVETPTAAPVQNEAVSNSNKDVVIPVVSQSVVNTSQPVSQEPAQDSTTPIQQ